MQTNNESGHAKNVANFETLTTKCVGYGSEYNPSVPYLKVDSLKQYATKGRLALSEYNIGQPSLTLAINEREAIFAPLSKLTTRAINSLIASQVPLSTVKDARSIANKIQGRRSKPAKSSTIKGLQGEEKKTISTAQLSFDNRINNFDRLINLLDATPEYRPNEQELQIESLKSLRDTMLSKNDAVVNATTALNQLRMARNEVLYGEQTGLVALAKSIKAYLKSVYGTTHPRFKEVSTINFKRLK